MRIISINNSYIFDAKRAVDYKIHFNPYLSLYCLQEQLTKSKPEYRKLLKDIPFVLERILNSLNSLGVSDLPSHNTENTKASLYFKIGFCAEKITTFLQTGQSTHLICVSRDDFFNNKKNNSAKYLNGKYSYICNILASVSLIIFGVLLLSLAVTSMSLSAGALAPVAVPVALTASLLVASVFGSLSSIGSGVYIAYKNNNNNNLSTILKNIRSKAREISILETRMRFA